VGSMNFFRLNQSSRKVKLDRFSGFMSYKLLERALLDTTHIKQILKNYKFIG